MIETIVTIEGGGELPALFFGASCGVVLARFGAWGLVFTGPMLFLVGAAFFFTLRQRFVLTAELAFGAGAAVAAWAAV